MKYLMTGSSGVVGKYLIKELLSDPNKYSCEQIVALSRKNRYFYEDHPGKESALLLECYGELTKNPLRLISQYRPSVIIHCAGIGTQASPAKDLWHANVDTTLNLLEACKVLDKVKFIYCSSIVVDHNPLNVYAASKIAGEALCRAYNNGDFVTQIVRFPAVAGAGNKHGVVKAVIEKLLDKSIEKLNLLDNSRKPFIYAGQLAQKILQLITLSKGDIFNFCPRNTITVEDIVKIAMMKTGLSKEVVFSENKHEYIEPVDVCGDIYGSYTAIELAINDILVEDYNLVI